MKEVYYINIPVVFLPGSDTSPKKGWHRLWVKGTYSFSVFILLSAGASVFLLNLPQGVYSRNMGLTKERECDAIPITGDGIAI